jgi:hypothetical protein
MAGSLTHWIGIAGTRALRIAVIAVIGFVLIRIWKALTTRLVHSAKTPTRVAQMRERQTRTMAGLLYSLGATIIAGALSSFRPTFLPRIRTSIQRQ